MFQDIYTKTYSSATYQHTTMVRHKGRLIAFAMDDSRRIYYSVLDLGGASSDPQEQAASALDVDGWPEAPAELIFPNEIAEVGFGVADQTQFSVFRKGRNRPEKPGTALPDPDAAEPPFKADYFRSTTARLSAPVPFKALSDGRYIYLFRQAVDADDANNLDKLDSRGEAVKDKDGNAVPIVDATLLVDRFLLVGNSLEPKMEVRFQRSRSKNRAQSRKDGLGAKDMDGIPFFEPTQELRFVGNLNEGRFAVLLLPTRVAEIKRWQIFTQNRHTGRIDSFNVERSADGLFNTRGSQIFTCVDHPQVFESQAGTCVEPRVGEPDQLCDKPLTHRVKTEGYAESALKFASVGKDHVVLSNGPSPGETFTQEAWLHPEPNQSLEPQALLLSEGKQIEERGPSIWIERQTRLRVGFGDGQSWHQFTTRPILSPGEWNHIAVTFDGEAYRFYVNGRLRDKTVELAGKQPYARSLRSFGDETNSFSGLIDEVRLWNRPRSSRELTDDVHRRLTGLEPGLLGYWRLDEAAGDQVFDQTIRGANGTIHGAQWVTSDAPVGEHPGVNRSSFGFTGRQVASGMATLLYHQQAEVASGYSGEKKPLKQSGRVMLALATEEIGNNPDDRPYVTALDFGVTATGKLAQVADDIKLRRIDADTGIDNRSFNERLDEVGSLQAQYRQLDQDIEPLAPVITKLDNALASPPSIAYDISDLTLRGLNDLLRQYQETLNERDKPDADLDSAKEDRNKAARLRDEKQIALDAAARRVQNLEDELAAARVTIYQHVDYKGRSLRLRLGHHRLTEIGFGDLSSFEIHGPLSVKLSRHDGSGRLLDTIYSDLFTEDTRFVGPEWNDKAIAIDLEPSHSYNLRYAKAKINWNAAKKALDTAIANLARYDQAVDRENQLVELRAMLVQARSELQEQKNEKEKQQQDIRTALEATRSLLLRGAAVSMPLLNTDPFGLTISGGLLSFAWTEDTPLIFDSATGSLALYFRGGDDQFFVTYYNTLTERARYPLTNLAGDEVVNCIARSADLEMDDLAIEIGDDGEDAETCTVTISGAGIEERWRQVPRRANGLAKVLNGDYADREYIGSGAIKSIGGQVTHIQVPGGIRRAINAGKTVVVGAIHVTAQESANSGATRIAVSSEALAVPEEKLPLFYLEYDYAAHASSSKIPADLYNGSLLIAAAVPEGLAAGTMVGNQHVTSGATLSSKWTAAAPGSALSFSGRQNYAALSDSGQLHKFDAADDLTLETWVRPARIRSKISHLIQHRSRESSYMLGLEARELQSALALNGSDEYVELEKGVTLTAPFTQEAWIYPLAGDDEFHGFLGQQAGADADASRAPSIWIYEKTKLHAGFGNGQQWLSTTTDDVLTSSAWNHVAVTFDGDAYRIYVNGLMKHEDAATFRGEMPDATPVRHIGKVDNFFPGRIDDVRLWKRARSREEILADMDRRLGGNETDLVGYWHFDYLQADDYSRYKNNGRLQGSPLQEASPLPAYAVFAGVNDQTVKTRDEDFINGNNWTHLAVAFNQSYALRFDGQGSHLDCGNDTTLDISHDLTIEVFLQTNGRRQGIISRGRLDDKEADQNVPYALFVTADRHLGFLFQNVQGQAYFCSSTKRLPDSACKVSVTRKRQTESPKDDKDTDLANFTVDVWDEIFFYIDGNQVGMFKFDEVKDPDKDVGNSHGAVAIGDSFRGGASKIDSSGAYRWDLSGPIVERLVIGAFKGIIGEVRIWNRALDSEKIQKKIVGSEKGLVSWWRFEEGRGSKAFDSKSNNHATLKGNIEWSKDPNPEGSSLALYLNGRKVDLKASAGGYAVSQDQFTLGARLQDSMGQYFKGEMEELRIWQVTRSEEQIQDNLFRRLTGERDDLIAYYTFDVISGEDGSQPDSSVLGDHSLRGNHLRISGADYILSTAPIGDDIPQVRSALAGIKTTFGGLIGSTPGVEEYGDLQLDSRQNLVGVLKRCYSSVSKGQWQLMTGFKVGDLLTEWIGQVQFAPQIKGYIEGAPPVPSENLTTRAEEGIGDLDDYNEASTIELIEAQETNYTYAASRDSGFDMSVSFKLGFMAGNESDVGFIVMTKAVDVENVIGLSSQFEHSLGWLQDARTGAAVTTERGTSLELRGQFAPEDDPLNLQIGRRFVPDNTGLVLVESETADVFALRLKENGALIAYQMRPNPDIPKDWNIINFPINPRYTKQGTLDGKIGLVPDVDYPNAMTYRPDSSYFKPIEAYALKDRIDREETELQLYFNRYEAGAKGRRQDAAHFSEGDLASGRMLDKLPQLQKRNIANTYVWTADGGLFAETLSTADVREESIGGSYEFTGMAGVYTDLNFQIFSLGIKLEIEALFGGHMNLSVQKSQESSNAFALEVALNKVERDILQRDEEDRIVFDYEDPLRPKAKKHPGKVDAFRFMTFYLEPKSDHRDLFFSRVVDPIWLEQSDDPGAEALRQARQDSKEPACWRLMHRVTYVSRVLPEFDDEVLPILERSMQTLQIDSNYELIKLLDPFVRDRLGSFAEFSQAVDGALDEYLPELKPHAVEIKQFMSLYYGIGEGRYQTGGDEDQFGEATLRIANQPPVVSAGQDQTIGLDGPTTVVDIEGNVIDDPLDDVQAIFVTWEMASGPVDVKFTDRHLLKTEVEFTKRGRYTLRLTADDGMLSASDEVTIIVNEPPVVSAGPDINISSLETMLEGLILDDGLGDPQTGTVTATSSQVSSGQGEADWDDKNKPQGKVAFDKRGHYLLKLTVDNETYSADDQLLVAVAARATAALEALYTFEQNSGQIVADVSGNGAPLDLKIQNPDKVVWISGGLHLPQAPALLMSNEPATDLVNAIQSSGEVSVEAWIKADDNSESGLARIISLSNGPTSRNFTLGQRDGHFHVALRTTSTDTSASNQALGGGDVAAGKLTHVVCTPDASGLTKMIINGVEVSRRIVSGDFSNWDDGFVLALGNELQSNDVHDRAWQGAYHLLALYSRALTQEEIELNYTFGADTNLPPLVDAGSDRVIDWPDDVGSPIVAQLGGNITHDRPTKNMNVMWSQIGGPGSPGGVDFDDEFKLDTVANFQTFGSYLLRLTVDDGELMSSDEIEIVINQPPRITIAPVHPLSLVGESVSTTLQVTIDQTGLGQEDAADMTGELDMQWERISGPASAQIEDRDAASTSVVLSERGVYEFAVTVDNGPLSSTQSAIVTVNQSPMVNAGAAQIVNMPVGATPSAQVQLAGEIVDSGLGNPQADLLLLWTVVSAPEQAQGTLGEDGQLDTTATFQRNGIYRLRLTATNRDNSELSHSHDVAITVNEPPMVDAGPEMIVNLPDEAVLDGTASDDGLPISPGLLSLSWSKASGPGKVRFSEPSADYSMAKFSKKGVYKLELTADDGAAVVKDSVRVVVNRAPVIDAGRTVHSEPDSIVDLKGTVKDDGRGDPLLGELSFQWTVVSGDSSAVTIQDPSALQTAVSVSVGGRYELQLTVSNGFLSSSDTVTVEIEQAETIVEEETIDGGVDSGNLALSSWSPASDELVLLALACRDKDQMPTVAGNGYTFELVESVLNKGDVFKIWLWRAMKESPSSGSIVITLPGNTLPAVAVATRFSAVFVDDTNGAGAIETSGTNAGPDPDDDDMLGSIVTKTDGAWAYAAGSHRLRTFSLPAGETELSINVTAGESGDITKLSCWYEGPVTPAGSVQLGAANDLSSEHDWAMILASIKPGATKP